MRSRISYMARNFQVVSTCSSGNGGGDGIERLRRQVQHHGAVLADRIEHHRLVGLGHHFAHDVDALGLQTLQMREPRWADRGRGLSHEWRLLSAGSPRLGMRNNRGRQPSTLSAAIAATCSAMASDEVRPGDSMPSKLIRPRAPCSRGPSI